MSAVSAKQSKRPESFRLSAELPGMLEKLAELNYASPSSYLEKLVATAEGVILRGEAAGNAHAFIARVRAFAEQVFHPRAARKTSYQLGSAYLEAIRELQDALQLSRQGLVVEYLVRAAWDVEGDDDGGDEDELKRRRRAGSRNLQIGRARPVSTLPTLRPLPGQLRLLEEDRSEG